jgi:Domain of unknown function (DUF397)
MIMIPAGRPQWRTSSYSSNGENCIEVAPVPSQVLVRDSKHSEAGTIEFSFPTWGAFIAGARDGEFG